MGLQFPPMPTPHHARLKELALQGLALAKDARAHADAKGQVRVSLAWLAPLMKAYVTGDEAKMKAELKQQIKVLADAFKKNGGWESKKSVEACDGMGHARLAYGALYAHALLAALARAYPVTAETVHDHNEAAEVGEKLMELLAGTKLGAWREAQDGEAAMVPWLNVLSAGHAQALAQPFTHQAENCLDAVLPADAQAGALHAQGADVTPDVWVYRELTALHALDIVAKMTGDAALKARIAVACHYHQGHTQPDYTTYQPWGVSAFLRQPETYPQAAQQLHDVATHFAIEGEGGAAVPAVILALTAVEK